VFIFTIIVNLVPTPVVPYGERTEKFDIARLNLQHKLLSTLGTLK
jgi:hypothetical protein